MITQRLRMRGCVQGVGYRDALRHQAELRGLTGWVRNRADGSVEALVQGLAEPLQELVAWARRGPPAARVTEVRVDLVADEAPHARFERLPTQ